MTLAELYVWPLQHRWGAARREELSCYLRQYAVYDSDDDLCRLWAEVTARAVRGGRPIEAADAWIAATALALDAPLVTNNPEDFAGVEGLTVLSS